MASKRGMSIRNEEAQARIDAAVERIATAGAFKVEPPPVYRRDPIRQDTERLERLAGIVEQAADALDDEGGDPAFSGAQADVSVTIDTMTREELNTLAIERGIEDPDKLPNKDAVIAAIQDAVIAAIQEAS